MKRQWWLSIVIIALVIVFRLTTSGGALSLPPNATQMAGNQIRIPTVMENIDSQNNSSDPANDETWLLTRRGDGTYYVTVYVNDRPSRYTFAAGPVTHSNASGTAYQTKGKVKFGAQSYHATDMYVNHGGKRGYIDFVKD
ncbi:hypothetical protein [Alicyclobacillus fodiniaquatilis]|jgi:hypothetical protein|uniref:Uncharacterized protein n=1 Tax=Alicyclobacillus fodiniaquatilis TaxID=1661150 RepID=A0ABW4JD39_9BACL